MNMNLIIYVPLIKPHLIKGLRTINIICHAIKDIICLTQTMHTQVFLFHTSIFTLIVILLECIYASRISKL